MNAELEPVRQSFFAWIVAALGFRYGLLLPVAGFICLILVLIVVTRGKGPMSIAALVLICPIPLLIGIGGALEGTIGYYQVIAMSQSTPRPSDLAEAISMAMVAPLAGLLMTAPSMFAAACGAFLRSITDSKTQD